MPEKLKLPVAVTVIVVDSKIIKNCENNWIIVASELRTNNDKHNKFYQFQSYKILSIICDVS